MSVRCQKFSLPNPEVYFSDNQPFASLQDPEAVVLSVSNCINNTFIVLHNTEMASCHSPCRKGFTCALLTLGSILTGVLSLAEAATRLALAILSSPLLFCCLSANDDCRVFAHISILAGFSSLDCALSFFACGKAAFDMLFKNEQLRINRVIL